MEFSSFYVIGTREKYVVKQQKEIAVTFLLLSMDQYVHYTHSMPKKDQICSSSDI